MAELAMKKIKRIIDFVPGGRRMVQTSLHAYHYAEERSRLHAIRAEGVFARINELNIWGNEESVSGLGSTIEYTHNLRRELPRIISRFQVKQILDAPCGDYNWFRLIERGKDTHYIGGDIVKTLVTNNQEKYGNNNTLFIHLDITKDSLPKADLWLCRDCLQHFSNADAFKVIGNLLNSDVRYFLASTHTQCKANKNILTGNVRQLNLELPPFNFCKPILYIDEDWEGEGWPIRRLALWEKHQLSECLASNKVFRRTKRGPALWRNR